MTPKKTSARSAAQKPAIVEPTPVVVAPRKGIQPKVAAAGIAGAVTTLIITGAAMAGFDISPEVAAALATIVAFAAGYIKTGNNA